jgi:hypothetical protein
MSKTLTGDTRLSEALDADDSVLEYIISLNPHDFNRLRTPLLRKVMPPRITLRRVAAIAGVAENELLQRVNELAGRPFQPGADAAPEEVPFSSKEPPAWMQGVDLTSINWVNCLPIDAEFGDPMPPINVAVNTSKPGEVVGIKHKWEPQPLFDIWQMRGFEFWTQKQEDDLWHIFVYRPKN